MLSHEHTHGFVQEGLIHVEVRLHSLRGLAKFAGSHQVRKIDRQRRSVVHVIQRFHIHSSTSLWEPHHETPDSTTVRPRVRPHSGRTVIVDDKNLLRTSSLPCTFTFTDVIATFHETSDVGRRFTPLETTATRASPPFVSGSPFVRRLDLVDTNTHPSRRVAFRSRSTDASVSTRGRRRSLSLSLSLLSSRLLSSRLVAPRHRLSRAVAFSKNSRAGRGDRPAAFVVVVVVVGRRTSDVDGERVR